MQGEEVERVVGVRIPVAAGAPAPVVVLAAAVEVVVIVGVVVVVVVVAAVAWGGEGLLIAVPQLNAQPAPKKGWER